MDRLNFSCQQLNSGGCRFVDGGRPGWLAHGLQKGGAADQATANRLNQLLDQAAGHPSLEFTLDGGQWLINGRGQIAMGGADMDWRLNGRPIERYTTIELDGDYLLQGGPALHGARSYLAVRGAWFGLPQVWASSSPGAPGLLPCTVGTSFWVENESIAPYFSDLAVDQYLPELPLKVAVLPGPEWQRIDNSTRNQLVNLLWKVAPNTNRQGIRLLVGNGLAPTLEKAPETSKLADWSTSGLQLKSAQERLRFSNRVYSISSPVLPGTIQWTPSGPILLFRDAQTLGGYPRALIAERESLNLIGQLKPGDELWFELGDEN